MPAQSGQHHHARRNQDRRFSHHDGPGRQNWKALNAAFYLLVNDVDATYAKALDAGATSQSAPKITYGHRNAGVVDSGGIMWWIAAPGQAVA